MPLTPRVFWGSLELTAAPYLLRFGTDLGAPEPVTQVFASLLQDGEIEITDRSSNRTLKLPIIVEGGNLLETAEAEAALALEARRPLNTLTIDPGDGIAPATVFQTFAGQLTFDRSDENEMNNLRLWNAEIRALPFGRSEDRTVVAAIAPPPTTPVTVSVDDGSSATGWTAANGSAPSSAGGAVSTTSIGSPAPASMNLVRNSSFAFGDGYLLVDWKAGTRVSGGSVVVSFTNGSVRTFDQVPPPYATEPAAGYVRTWYRQPAGLLIVGTIAIFRFNIQDMLPGEVMAIDRFAVTDSAGQSPVIIDDGSSATNWFADAGYGVTSTGGAIQGYANGSRGSLPVTLTRTGSVDISSTRYMVVDWSLSTNNKRGAALTVVTGGATYQAELLREAIAPSGLVRSYYAIPVTAGPTVSSLTFGMDANVPHGSVLTVDQISRTNTIVGLGTYRQQSRSLTVGGSARTQASLVVTAGGNEDVLGSFTMVYTRNGGGGYIQPPLGRWGSPGTLQDTNLSGYRTPGGNSFRIPATRLADASYNVIAVMHAVVPGTYAVTWEAKMVNASGVELDNMPGASETVMVALGSDYGVYDIGIASLPPIGVAADSTLQVRFNVGASASMELDEVWLCDTDHGALSIVDTRTLSRLEIRTADLDNERPSYWGGMAADASATDMMRIDDRVLSWGTHTFNPGQVDVCTATQTSVKSSASLSYYMTWHTNAAGAA